MPEAANQPDTDTPPAEPSPLVVQPRWPGASGSMPVATIRNSGRIDAIEFTCGVMMIALAGASLAPRNDGVIASTIGLVTASGLLVGWFATVKYNEFEGVAAHYSAQAVRLLLVVHPVLSLAVFTATSRDEALRTLFVTDTLALIFFAIVPIVPRMRSKYRLALGLAVIVANLFVDDFTKSLPIAHDLLCGADPTRRHVVIGSAGVLPLSGAFLVGTWLGTQLGKARTPDLRMLPRRVVLWACQLVGIALLLIGWRLLAHVLPSRDGTIPRLDFASALYPAYLACTLLVLALALRLRKRSRIVTAIGKAWWLVYCAQYVLALIIRALVAP